MSRRTIFIQTEDTPNADVRIQPIPAVSLRNHPSNWLHNQALKFKPNQRILPENFASPYVEYLSPRSTLAAPHPSPLAASLINVDGVTSVFFGTDYITITKDSGTSWAHIKPEVFSLVTEAVTGGQQIVSTVAGTADGESGQEGGGAVDSLAYDENDSEVVSMIKELLETRIRPAIQEDGGDIEFRGFENGQVRLKLRGACRTCDSSTVTLRNGIESMLVSPRCGNLTLWNFTNTVNRCTILKRLRGSSRSSTRRKKWRLKSLRRLRRDCACRGDMSRRQLLERVRWTLLKARGDLMPTLFVKLQREWHDIISG
jgi:Fe-S cluster biogenesis protein NfuA